MADGFIDGGFGQAVVFDGTIFFSGHRTSGIHTLWKIDSATHTLVQIPMHRFRLVAFGRQDQLCILPQARVEAGGTKLWKADFASAAPEAVETSGSLAINPEWLTNVNGTPSSPTTQAQPVESLEK